jgi:recombination protein RecT
MATQLATRDNSPVAVIRQNLTAMAPSFKAALPAHISVEKFTRVAQTAITGNPDLLEADRQTLFAACVRLAQDGLLPDGREAALVIFNTKDRNSGGWVKKVQAMPMIAGVLKKLRQSGEVAKISSQVVYEQDEFVVSYGFDEDVTHRPPALDKPRGRPIGAYATAVLTDGSRLLEVMGLEEINQVRNVSRSKDKGPWVDWWSEMARKTVMRRLAKRLPMSSDRENDVFERDETLAPEVRAVEHDAAPTQPGSRLDALESQIAGSDGTLADDNPAATEGRDDREMGERTDADDLIASFERVTTADELASATKAMYGLDLGDDPDVLMARDAASERVA